MAVIRRRRSVLAVALLGVLAVAAPALAQWRAEGPDLGTVNDLSVDPSSPDTVYAATHNGGVWRSDDFGRTWSLPAADVETNMSGRTVRWVEADPGTPGTVWCGIDHPGYPALYRSRDRGATWQRVDDRVQAGEIVNMDPTGARIAFAPAKPAEIWVPSTNLHFRSRDGGKTWSDFRVPDQDVYAIAVDPADPKVVYAGGRGSTNHLSRSDDGGKTWKKIGRGLPEQSISDVLVDPKNPTNILVAVGFSDLFRSADRGETFAPLPTPAGGTDELYRLRLDPRDGHVVWAATEKGLFVSRDGGATWRGSDEGTGSFLVRSVAFDPRDPRRMLAASGGGGVYRSEDGGASWSLSGQGLAAGWVKRLYGAPGSPALFAQIGSSLWKLEAPGRWSAVGAPFADDDGDVQPDGITFDPHSPGTVWVYRASTAWRSVDGRRFEALEPKQPSVRQLIKGDLGSAQFQSFALDAGDSKVLYAGSWSNQDPGQAVYRSKDGGKSFQPAGNGISAERVTALASPSPGVVLAVAEGKSLYRTTNGGGAWSTAGSGLPDVELRQLATDPSEPQRVYVATEKGLFRSADQGASFTAAGGALAGEDVEAVVVAPDGKVFAASFHGVFVSSDGGATFTSMAGGLPLADVRALAIGGPAPPRLYAGTAGESVWSIALP